MTIAVDLGRKATTNKQTVCKVIVLQANGQTEDTFDPHPRSLGNWNLLLHTPVAQQIWLDNLSSCLEDSITNKYLIYRRRQSQYLLTPFKKSMVIKKIK